MRKFAAALTLLTIIPVPGYSANENDIERCKPFFPLVGIIIGGIVAGIAWLSGQYLPTAVGAIILVVILSGISCGFHVDGLADTADGFMSSRPKDKILEIMHDSRIGTMGVLAIFAVLGIKAAAFYSMMPEQLMPTVFLAAVSGRCAIVFYVNISRYARPSGLGEIMFRRKSILNSLWALSIMFGLCGWLLGYRGLVAAATVMIFCIAWRGYCKHKIGGATGDTIGACEEISEMLIPLVICLKFF